MSQARSDANPPMLARDGAARVGLLGLARTASKTGLAQYSRRVAGESAQWFEASELLRRLVPLFALAVALVAVGTEPSSSSGDLVLVGLPPMASACGPICPECLLPALALAVIVPVAAAQRSGELEPLLFELSVLAFVVARWSQSRTTAIALGLLTVPATVAVAQTARDRRPQLDHGHHLPLGRRPRLRAPRAGGSRARGDAARTG